MLGVAGRYLWRGLCSEAAIAAPIQQQQFRHFRQGVVRAGSWNPVPQQTAPPPPPHPLLLNQMLRIGDGLGWRMPVLPPVPPPPALGVVKEYEGRGRVGVARIEEPVVPEEMVDGPGGGVVEEKRAARLIVIRRTKMNKHKLRKLRKRMKFVWGKVRQRREMRREREYLNSKMILIQDARKFDAKDFVASVIRKAKEEPIPRRWQDPIMPQWYKEQEINKEIEAKRFQKAVDLYLNHKIKIQPK